MHRLRLSIGAHAGCHKNTVNKAPSSFSRYVQGYIHGTPAAITLHSLGRQALWAYRFNTVGQLVTALCKLSRREQPVRARGVTSSKLVFSAGG